MQAILRDVNYFKICDVWIEWCLQEVLGRVRL